jgi:hypothetical protein
VRIETSQRRARLARRHHLAPEARADGVAEVAEGLVALHATDPASVYLSVFARMRAPRVEAVEQALYDERSLVRLLGMRRTMFVVPVALAPIIQAACTGAIAKHLRTRLVGWLEQAGIAEDGASWLRAAEEATQVALAARGRATGAQLSRDVAQLRERIPMGEGKKWAGEIGVSTQVLSLLSANGHIVRGRPRGTWVSSQYEWVPAEAWLPSAASTPTPEEARTELARRWLRAFGPATALDLKWWTGWTLTHARAALAALGAVEVELDPDGTTGYVLDDDRDPVTAPEPWAALLPALDTTVMGWTERSWFLGPHRPQLFDRSGNAGPTVWWDGRVVGGWGQRPDAEVVFRLLEDIGADAVVAIEAAAERLSGPLGGVRVTPRFRTPLERELAA